MRIVPLARNIYSFLFYLAVPFVFIRLLWRSRKEPLYRETPGERFGFCAPITREGAGVIWVHSVSAGETIAAVPLVKRLMAAGYRLVVTTMTPTGRERVRSMLPEDVFHFYAPWDMPGAIRRFLQRTHPRALVIIDTELWPNMVHHAARQGTRVMLVNGRLSARSYRGYARVPMIVKPMLAAMSAVATQTVTHGQRFVELGLDEEKLTVAGSIKFDLSIPEDIEQRRRQLSGKIGERPVFIAASTHAGEEEQVLDAAARARVRYPRLLTIVAPRHPHRCDDVQSLCEARGHLVVRHSAGIACAEETSILLLDTMGELLYFYAVSDVAFIGGSLVPVGGHNLMEAAALGTPVVMGPHLDNVDDIADLFMAARAMSIVNNGDELGDRLVSLLSDQSLREQVASNAMQVVTSNRGALDRVERLVREMAGDP